MKNAKDFFKNIEAKELMKLANKAKFVMLDLDDLKSIELHYGQCALDGSTDYKDHRKDTLEELKEILLAGLERRLMQKGHYYNRSWEPFDTIVLHGRRGGWSAYCKWSDGSKSRFES